MMVLFDESCSLFLLTTAASVYVSMLVAFLLFYKKMSNEACCQSNVIFSLLTILLREEKFLKNHMTIDFLRSIKRKEHTSNACRCLYYKKHLMVLSHLQDKIP